MMQRMTFRGSGNEAQRGSGGSNEAQRGNASNRGRTRAFDRGATARVSISDQKVVADTAKKKVFVDAEEMKARIREQTLKPVYNVAIYYHTSGIWQKIAKHAHFEHMTLSVIALNALWIAIDTDFNGADVITQAEPMFQCAEHFFCCFFSLEWVVRFMAFKRKRDGFRDAWFIFDSILVAMMVLETWVMCMFLLATSPSGGSGPMGNASMLRMARLMRLSRVARMARLFRAMPQLLIVVKALFASLSSCGFVFVLLITITYVFGIALRQLTMGHEVGDLFFHNVPKSMYTLWVDGTILDEPDSLSNALWDAHPLFPVIFWVFTGLSALLIMNMLIGVLCEVVSAVSGAEKERYNAEYVKGKLQDIMREIGIDSAGDELISKAELSSLLEIPSAHKALSDVGVDVFMLVDNIDFLFSNGPEDEGDDDVSLTFEEFMNLVLELRGSNTATVNDVVDLKKYIKRANANLRDELRKAMAPPVTSSSPVLIGNKAPAENSAPAVARTLSKGDASYQYSRNLPVTVETMRQEFSSIIQQSLIPELSRACIARQQEMNEEMSDLIRQVRGELAKPFLPEVVHSETSSCWPSMKPSVKPPHSEIPLANGGAKLSSAREGLGTEAQTAQTSSPQQAGSARAKDQHGQSLPARNVPHSVL